MSDYESQYLADLERAQALSMESLALEQYRQKRNIYAGNSTISENDPNGSARSHSNVNELPQPIPPPPRRPARRPRTSTQSSTMRSTSNSPVPCDIIDDNVDLISFNTPSSVEKSHMELKERINRLHQQYEPMALVPIPADPKLSRSNSSAMTYSAQNMYPYPLINHTRSKISSETNFPTSTPYIQNLSKPKTNNSCAAVDRTFHFKDNDGFGDSFNYLSQNKLYPNLHGIETDNISQIDCEFNNFLNNSKSSNVQNNLPNILSCPQLNAISKNQTNIIDDQDFNNIVYRKNVSTSHSIENEFSNIIESSNINKNCNLNTSKSNIEINMDTNKTARPSRIGNPKETSLYLPKPVKVPASFGIKPLITDWASTSQQEKSLNLIDLASYTGTSDNGNPQFSLLEAFDPLIAEQNINDYTLNSECSSSIYEEYDPLDYIYSENKSKEPIYAIPDKQDDDVLSPLPSPPPKSLPPQFPKIKRSNTLNRKLYETVIPIKTRRYESELVAFLDMIKDVRSRFLYSNTVTNPGYVVASKSEGTYPSGTSIKLLVHYKDYPPMAFTCDVESTVEHIVLHVVCGLEGEINDDISVYSLRVWGMSEYLTSGSCLKEYTYVRQCVRLEKDVVLCLQSTTNTSLARTERDDMRDSHITLEKLLPNQGLSPPISHHNLSILLETFERELTRVVTSVTDGTTVRIGATSQAVKAICALLGGVETVHISTALGTLIHACNQQSKPEQNIKKAEIISDAGDYSNVSLRQATLKDTVGLHCQRLRDAVRGFISIYCRANRVDFELEDYQYVSNENNPSISSLTVNETVLFCIEGIHRPPVHWNHDEYIIHSQIYYGTGPLKTSQSTPRCVINTAGFYPRILFETWLNLTEISISKLPKESRLVLTLTGRTLPKVDNQNANSERDKAADSSQESPEKVDLSNGARTPSVEQEELGWSAIQMFDFDGKLVSGNFILPLWPVCADKRLGPAPNIMDYPPQCHPLIHLEIPSYSQGGVHWQDCSESMKNLPNVNRHSFESLDTQTQQQLMHLVEQGPHQKMPSNCREILWEKRHYLVEIPGALPLVLLASVNWDSFSRYQLLQLLDQWKSPSPYDALHMLLPCFPDDGVRAKAVDWLSKTSTATLITLMPQLCLALRYESHVGSRLTRLLLTRALESPRFAHRLYWQLVHDIPGNSPQNSSEESLGIMFDGESFSGTEPDDSIIAASRWMRRNQIMLRALLEIVGTNLAERLLKQQLLVKGLTDVANSVKKCKESIRNRILETGVNNLIPLVTSNNVCLPLSVSQELFDIDVKSCSYFPSNTLPLKISFISSDNTTVPAIFKVGDDLRQDSLVLQVMRIMDELWLREGLDLSMVTFEAVPTQYRKGIIEMVCSAETLRSIQVEWGLTGSFKDKPIAEWLAKHNPSELEYERAVTNFTASSAGYSVATYILGICDRHNDNIMLKTSGHLFHIDFGKFLGDAQMFGNFKRDRTPFVLTPDMAYVINGSEHPSEKFHHFVDLCCTAFNIVRKHHNLILNLFSLMASSGISGVSASSVGYVRAALLPGQSPAEAAATFARLIHSALKSKFTPINFFLHNLAQLRAGDQSATSNELLSFMPKTYTVEQDGRIVNVDVVGYEKRYDPEKYYVYALRTFRHGQVTPSIVYRSYKHFTELYQKICLEHPLAKVHRLPVGLHMGRSNTKQAAERRYGDINAFVHSLFSLADEISHSKLVYTFFHPLLRDQQEIAPQRVKHKNDIQHHIRDSVGALKISIQYFAGVLSVLILHARTLPVLIQNLPPSPYVKVYLIPDPSKETKRKTRVLKKNCHPSFMEMLEYRLPLEVIRGRDLQATVWHHDTLQENQFLGGVCIPLHSMDLSVETVEWYPLQYITR